MADLIFLAVLTNMCAGYICAIHRQYASSCLCVFKVLFNYVIAKALFCQTTLKSANHKQALKVCSCEIRSHNCKQRLILDLTLYCILVCIGHLVILQYVNSSLTTRFSGARLVTSICRTTFLSSNFSPIMSIYGTLYHLISNQHSTYQP